MRRPASSKSSRTEQELPGDCAHLISRRKVLGGMAAAGLFGGMGRVAGVGSAAVGQTNSGSHANGTPQESVSATTYLPQHHQRSPLKSRAQRDYSHSLRAFGGRLASPIGQLLGRGSGVPHVDVCVIGSGYGAAACALRLAQRLGPDRRICILERGREWVPGTFPDSYRGISSESRAAIAGKQRGQIVNPLGLYNLNFSDEINTLSGSALGGTSLINANVALKADSEVFTQSRWPVALRERAILDPYYELAAQQMNLSRTVCDTHSKMAVRRASAQRVSRRPGFYDRSPLTVTYDHRFLDDRMQNQFGMVQRVCNGCGDCITGCNVGAKNHLLTNYLPMARAHGAEMYTQIEVTSIQPWQGGYQVRGNYHDDSCGQLATTPICISAEMVVLGCGSPSSAQLLLQSQSPGFRFSPTLGQNWTFNGDTIGFVMDGDFQARIAGVGANDPMAIGPGPTIQTTLIYERRPKLQERILIQEAALPTAVTQLFKFLVRDRELDNSMVMLGMGHDEGQGQIVWKDQRWQVEWPGLKTSAYRQMMFREFERLARAHGGWYKRLKAFGDNLVTVHPLGGCGMSDDPQQGVVNHLGQVYDVGPGRCNGDGPAVHPGLYVADGSVFPTPIGVNPFMTIAAVAERTAHHITANPAHAHLFNG